MKQPSKLAALNHRFPRWRWVAAALAALVLLGLWLRRGSSGHDDGATFVARRGPLDITVLEGGSVQAREAQEVKCEVRVGYQGIKVLKIVEEGYLVTPEDVRTNKLLVELDSSDLKKQITQQDIQYEQSVAALTDAQQTYEIQLYQNLSDIKAAEQKMRFARLDFEKFLGTKAAVPVIEQLGLSQELASAENNALARLVVAATGPAQAVSPKPSSAPSGHAPPTLPTNGPASASAPLLPPTDGPAPLAIEQAPAVVPPASPTNAPALSVAVTPRPAVLIDFAKYAQIEVLGDGEAKQKLRKFEDDLQVAKKELGQAQATLEGTQRLFEKGFVTKIDRERDEIAHENSRLKVQTAETARDLFLKYEFTKTAEESLSKFDEAVRELIRARKAAISKLAQAEAKLKSAQGQFNIQERARKELNEQLEKCTIAARKSGLVIYGGMNEDRWGGEERIREGATVREHQAILTIPDMSQMSVRVKIHESYIKKVKQGQKARVTVDAYADKLLDGAVTKVGVLPDSQNRWMNPDMKVYLTTIEIQGTHDWLKPGMTAKVEIVVDRLADVVYVPIQAVAPFEGKHVCFIANGGKPDRRHVEIGEFNDAFIEVKSGLAAGDRVLLRADVAPAPVPGDESGKPAKEAKPATPQPAAAPGATARKT